MPTLAGHRFLQCMNAIMLLILYCASTKIKGNHVRILKMCISSLLQLEQVSRCAKLQNLNPNGKPAALCTVTGYVALLYAAKQPMEFCRQNSWQKSVPKLTN